MLATITDKRLQIASGSSVDHYTADVASAQDYYTFGMQMPNRNFNAGGYRYGFNGQEKSTEIDPDGNLNTAEFWEYDGRLGRRWNVDPVVKPWESGYAAFADSPIEISDPDGDNGKTPTAPPADCPECKGVIGSTVEVHELRTRTTVPDKTHVAPSHTTTSHETSGPNAILNFLSYVNEKLQGRTRDQWNSNSNYKIPFGYTLTSATGNGESFNNGTRAVHWGGTLNMDDFNNLATPFGIIDRGSITINLLGKITNYAEFVAHYKNLTNAPAAASTLLAAYEDKHIADARNLLSVPTAIMIVYKTYQTVRDISGVKRRRTYKKGDTLLYVGTDTITSDIFRDSSKVKSHDKKHPGMPYTEYIVQ